MKRAAVGIDKVIVNGTVLLENGELTGALPGRKAYPQAVEEAFGADIDYAMLVKLYGPGPATTDDAAGRRYSPAECIGFRKDAITGKPDPR